MSEDSPRLPTGFGPYWGISYLLIRAGLGASRRLEAGLASLKLDLRQFALLNAIEFGEGRSQQALGTLAQIPPTRMVALVDGLEGRELVERRSDPSDRRVNALYLTPKGAQALNDARSRAFDNEVMLAGRLTPAERDQLVALLTRLEIVEQLPYGLFPGPFTDVMNGLVAERG